MTSPSTLSFGPFAFDASSGELTRDGRPVALREQSRRLLAVLLADAGRLLTRQRLCDELWPDGIHVDFEHGLNTAVRRLRDALGDAAESPQFIETVPRRGYRFIAPLERPQGAIEPAFALLLGDDAVPLSKGIHVIGRNLDSLIRTTSSTISRRHARIIVTESNVTLEDLGSTNGTFVADRRIESPTILRNGDRIVFGDTLSAVFQVLPGLPETERNRGDTVAGRCTDRH